MQARFKAAGLLWVTIAALAALGLLLGLGTWQLGRMAWKMQLIATIADRAAATPVAHTAAVGLSCSRASDDIMRSCDYRRLRLRGTFDHAGERHIFAGALGSGPSTQVGYWILTPFLPEAANPTAAGKSPPAILVNRGFVPENLKAPLARIAGQVTGPVEILAQIRTRQTRSWFDGQNDAPKNIYYVRDPRELGQPVANPSPEMPVLGSGWFYLEVVEGLPPGGWPRPMPASATLANRHLEYAITWYGLALTLIGVFAAFARGRLKAPRAQPNTGCADPR